MTAEGSIAIRKICFRGLGLAGLLASAYLIFLSIISIWVGVKHLNRAGSWVPVLAGALLFLLVSWVLIRIARRAFRSKKRDGFIV